MKKYILTLMAIFYCTGVYAFDLGGFLNGFAGAGGFNIKFLSQTDKDEIRLRKIVKEMNGDSTGDEIKYKASVVKSFSDAYAAGNLFEIEPGYFMTPPRLLNQGDQHFYESWLVTKNNVGDTNKSTVERYLAFCDEKLLGKDVSISGGWDGGYVNFSPSKFYSIVLTFRDAAEKSWGHVGVYYNYICSKKNE
ncbi:hypothetical protein [Chromobacterium sinusclupearum]|uniref:hypothetical protein n=1 Tax=Chromobacterium sinusclupearum TaxID=2077146 RepID=UPI0011AF04FE|nr:hypothetical protein [Chromobacterium sinusclupearum]